jgi:hypothetical protein
LVDFEGRDLEEGCFEDLAVEVADVEGFEVVDVGFEDVVLEDNLSVTWVHRRGHLGRQSSTQFGYL